MQPHPAGGRLSSDCQSAITLSSAPFSTAVRRYRAVTKAKGREASLCPSPSPLTRGTPLYTPRMTTPRKTVLHDANLKWVRDRFPESRVVVASLHRDETAPHIHVVIAPAVVNPKTGDRQWGWCKASRGEKAARPRNRTARCSAGRVTGARRM